MNNHQRDIAILQKLLDATRSGSIHWVEDSDEWYSATIGGREVNIRFLYFEATNQVGADRQMLELYMPGRNARFACGTEGWDLLLEILSVAFESMKKTESFDPLEFLNKSLPN